MRSKQPRLACVGDLALDVVVRAEGPIESGTDVPGTVRFRVGGSAANTARAFATLGGRAVFIGAVGDDTLGGRLAASLRAAGVTVRLVKMSGPSTRVLVLIERSGERSFVTDRGVADRLTPKDLKRSWLSGVHGIHLPAYSLLHPPLSDAAMEAARWVRDRGGFVSLDLASRRPLLVHGRRTARQVVARAAPDLLFGNEAEAAALVDGARELRLLSLAPIVVIKQGSGGCRVLWRSPGAGTSDALGHSTVATKPIAATDTTGAGDAFDAGFLFALIASGYVSGTAVRPTLLRRAALAGHRAAGTLLSRPRTELVL